MSTVISKKTSVKPNASVATKGVEKGASASDDGASGHTALSSERDPSSSDASDSEEEEEDPQEFFFDTMSMLCRIRNASGDPGVGKKAQHHLEQLIKSSRVTANISAFIVKHAVSEAPASAPAKAAAPATYADTLWAEELLQERLRPGFFKDSPTDYIQIAEIIQSFETHLDLFPLEVMLNMLPPRLANTVRTSTLAGTRGPQPLRTLRQGVERAALALMPLEQATAAFIDKAPRLSPLVFDARGMLLDAPSSDPKEVWRECFTRLRDECDAVIQNENHLISAELLRAAVVAFPYFAFSFGKDTDLAPLTPADCCNSIRTALGDNDVMHRHVSQLGTSLTAAVATLAADAGQRRGRSLVNYRPILPTEISVQLSTKGWIIEPQEGHKQQAPPTASNREPRSSGGRSRVKSRMRNPSEEQRQAALRMIDQTDNDKRNTGPSNRPPARPVQASAPFEKWVIDLKTFASPTTAGNSYLLVAVDVYSRYLMLWPLRSKTSAEVAKGLHIFCSLLGFPKLIICDLGEEFQGEITQEFSRDAGVEFTSPPAGIKTATGIVESTIRNASELLDKLARGSGKEWDQFHLKVMNVINNRLAHDELPSPNELIRHGVGFSSDVPLPADADQEALIDDIIHADLPRTIIIRSELDDARAKARDARARLTSKTLEPGTRVYVRRVAKSPKAHPFTGPYFIVDVDKTMCYRIKDTTGRILKARFHISQIKRALPTHDDPVLTLEATRILDAGPRRAT